jgi:YHS domain-containing protein
MSTTTIKSELVNFAGASNVALSGYDPVAFFTDSNPVNGEWNITSSHRGATYFFANEENKAEFATDPEKYAPQNGGFCSFGVSVGALFPVDITTWQVHNDKLYLTLNPDVNDMFNQDLDGNIAKAANNWPGLVEKNAK